MIVPCDYPRTACEADRWGGGIFGPRVAFAAKSYVVREPISPASAAEMATALEQLHQFTDRTHADRRLTWLRDVHATMQPHLGTGGYTNGMDPELTVGGGLPR
ncbi:hypothetical protein BIV23_41580 [Streptomyces monashensis]|uniref:Uncharacterized protein n=2 Tax=Streptomyces monashensis TaxID=1678012 RepID=A0A1S2P7G1_9ACTN|nr:hypothetical protein BIV23_41580 [Streptomyces monashensis]